MSAGVFDDWLSKVSEPAAEQQQQTCTTSEQLTNIYPNTVCNDICKLRKPTRLWRCLRSRPCHCLRIGSNDKNVIRLSDTQVYCGIETYCDPFEVLGPDLIFIRKL